MGLIVSFGIYGGSSLAWSFARVGLGWWALVHLRGLGTVSSRHLDAMSSIFLVWSVSPSRKHRTVLTAVQKSVGIKS